MKKLILSLAVLALFNPYTFAAEKYDTKSFRIIQKLCYSCHGTAFYLAKQLDDDDWEYLFETKGKLEKIHKKKPKALKVLKNKKFKYNKKRLLKFFIDNSKFSGSVHGCDANFCGTHH